MRPLSNQSIQTATILTLAEIKAAPEAFDRGETNAFDALDAIVVEFGAYRAAARPANSLEAA
jgi:hypothetical protein